jgi:hypothetical protein
MLIFFFNSSEDSVEELSSLRTTNKYRLLKKKAMRDQHNITNAAIELGQERVKLQV